MCRQSLSHSHLQTTFFVSYNMKKYFKIFKSVVIKNCINSNNNILCHEWLKMRNNLKMIEMSWEVICICTICRRRLTKCYVSESLIKLCLKETSGTVNRLIVQIKRNNSCWRSSNRVRLFWFRPKVTPDKWNREEKTDTVGVVSSMHSDIFLISLF